MKTSWS